MTQRPAATNLGKLRRFAFAAFCAAFVGLLAGTEAPSQTTVQPQLLVSTEWLAEHLNDSDLVVVHVSRAPEGYQAGHIPGARFLNRAEVGNAQQGLANEFPPTSELITTVQRLGIGAGSRVVIYDEAAGLDAARTFVAFDYLGFGDRAALLDGQWKKWKAENRPISAEVPPVSPSSWVPRPRPELILTLDAVRKLSSPSQKAALDTNIVDARPEAQYKGEQAPQGMRAGHIPGAQCVFWQANIVSQDNPVMRPVAELRQLYQGVKPGPGNTVVTYCNTGAQASFAYFTLRYLGYNVRLYDGSIEEWSRVPDAPLETVP
jgi:thiosulfate/3-mercaptopyruvate sulfurtransferase